MTFPRPALEQLSCPSDVAWVRTYLLQNQDGSGIDGTRLEARFELWNQARTALYGEGAILWNSRVPASITVTVAPAVLAAIEAGAEGIGYGDLLVINSGMRQYLVEVELTPEAP